MSTAMPQKSIEIQHEWSLRSSYANQGGYQRAFIPMYSNSLTTKTLPGVQFEIYSGLIGVNTLKVVISKTPCIPAKATIKIFVASVEQRQMKIDDWINNCIFTDIPYNLAYDSYSNRDVKVKCVIAWDGFVHQYESPRPIGLYGHTKHLLTTSEFADIVITVDDKKILAHKIILAVQSPVFSAMFQTNMEESTSNNVNIKDIEFEIMEKVVKFLYSGKLDANLDVDVLLQILAAADKYQIIDLKDACERILHTKITIGSALKILDEASLYGVPQLIEATNTFMVKNKTNIAELDEFKELLLEKPGLFFEFIIRIIGR